MRVDTPHMSFPGDMLPAAPPRTVVSIASVMEDAVARFSPETLARAKPFDIAEYFEHEVPVRHEVPIDVVEYLPPGIQGEIDGNEIRIPQSVYIAARAGSTRARETLAHETAHAILHAPFLRFINHSQRKSRVVFFQREHLHRLFCPEYQADVGAAAMLMPPPAIAAIRNDCRITRNANLVRAIRRTLRVTVPFAQWWLEVLEENPMIH